MLRNPRLDILRAVAVIAVMCQHSGPHHNGLILPFARLGWAGVDLFFVLSGYLISGLLFSEHRKTGDIRIKRFLIRRGFKIYPSFYVFLVGATVISYFFSRTMVPTAAQFLHDALFIQNYFPGVMAHTWSLAVEEHFYILLPPLLLLLLRKPKSIPYAFLVVAFLAMLSRWFFIRYTHSFVGLPVSATNSRMDALFFGVLLSYLHHFHAAWLESSVRRYRWPLGILCAALLSLPLYVDRESFGFVVFGLTAVYLGCGLLLLLSLFVGKSGRIGKPLAAIGVYSYSIYLWHLPIIFWVPSALARLGIHLGDWELFAVYVPLALLCGVLAAKAVELPMLKVRDNFFPARGIKAT